MGRLISHEGTSNSPAEFLEKMAASMLSVLREFREPDVTMRVELDIGREEAAEMASAFLDAAGYLRESE